MQSMLADQWEVGRKSKRTMGKKYKGPCIEREAGTENKRKQCSFQLLKHHLNEMWLHPHQIAKMRKLVNMSVGENADNGTPHMLLAGMWAGLVILESKLVVLRKIQSEEACDSATHPPEYQSRWKSHMNEKHEQSFLITVLFVGLWRLRDSTHGAREMGKCMGQVCPMEHNSAFLSTRGKYVQQHGHILLGEKGKKYNETYQTLSLT